MKKKIFSILSATFAITAPCFAISCATAKEANVQKSEVKEIRNNNDKNLAWKTFINQDYIKTILNLAYHNDKSKISEYIKKQEQINDEQYKELLSWSLLYGNGPVASLKSDGDSPSFLNPNKKDTRPTLLIDSADNIQKLIKDNWLWFLFNLDRFLFTFYSDTDKFDISKGATLSDLGQGKQNLVGAHYRPLNTRIKQYIIQEYKSTLYEKDYRIFLLNEDGFIITVTVSGPTGIEKPDEDDEIDWDDEDFWGDDSSSDDSGEESDDSSIEGGETNTKPNVNFPIFGSGTSVEVTNNSEPAKQPDPFSIEVSQYLFSYPDLALNKKVIEKFDLGLYVRYTQGFDLLKLNRTQRVLFEEKYGGNQLRFAPTQLIKK